MQTISTQNRNTKEEKSERIVRSKAERQIDEVNKVSIRQKQANTDKQNKAITI